MGNMVLDSIFSPSLIIASMESEEKEEAFEELIDLFVSKFPSVSRADALRVVRERESKQTTGVKPGIAVPHARLSSISSAKGIIGISKAGIDYDAMDGQPVHVIFLLFSTHDDYSTQLRSLRTLSVLLDDPAFYTALLSAKDADSIYNTICKFEDILTTSM